MHLRLLHEGQLVALPFHDFCVPPPHLVDEALHLRRQIQAGRKNIHFRSLMRSAEQLSAEDRWRRILTEALKKYLRGRQPGRQPWLPPLRPALAG